MIRAVLLPAVLAMLASLGGTSAPPAAADMAFAISLPPRIATSSIETRLTRPASSVAVRQEDGLFYVEAAVNGTPVRFIVDTGSNIVILNARDAARAGVDRSDQSEVALRTVGGHARMHRRTLAQLSVAGQSIEDVDAATINGDLPVSLLGQSALSRLRSIKFAGDRLQLN